MSATINADEFAYYFRTYTVQHQTILAPIIQVDKRSKFSNTIFFVENLSTAVTSTICRVSGKQFQPL